MPETIGDAFVAVHADTTQFTSGLKGAAAGIAGIFAGVKVGQFLSGSLAEAKESQVVAAQTAAVLKSTGGAAQVSAGQVNNLANELSKMAGVDDEAIQSSENLLLTFRDVKNEAGKGNDVFTQATKTILDMSKALGEDLNGATIQVGKALQDPIAGLTALRRVGVAFTEDQKAQIKALVESGDKLGAQKIILRELTQEFGGSAAAQATAGDKAKVAIDNLKESIGIALMPAVKVAAEAITALANGFNALPAPARSAITVTTLVAGGFLAVALAAEKFGGGIQLIGSTVSLATDALAGLTSVLAGMTAAEIAAQLATLGLVAAFVAAGAAIVYLAASGTGPFERAQKAASDWGKTTIQAAKGTGDELKSLQGTMSDVQGHVTNLTREQKLLSDAIASGQPGAQELQDQLSKVSNELLIQQDRAKALSPEIARLKAEQANLKAEHQASISALQQYTLELVFGGSATKAFSDLTQAGQKAIQDFQSALLAASGSQQGFEQAVAAQAKAQTDYNNALALGGPAVADATGATAALQQAQQNAATATITFADNQQKLIDKYGDNKPAAEAEIARLKDLQSEYPQTAASLDPLINRIQFIIDHPNVGTTVTVTANSKEVDDLLVKLDQLKVNVAGLPGVAAAIYLNPPPGKQHGGPVQGGKTYLVGEKGPELLTMPAAGYVTPNSALKGVAGGININGDLVVRDTGVLADLDYWYMTRVAGAGI